MARVYFAHPVTSYCSSLEDSVLDEFTAMGHDVVTPSDREHQQHAGRRVGGVALSAGCQGVAFLPLPDGRVTDDVADAVHVHVAMGHPVWRVDPHSGLMSLMSEHDWFATPHLDVGEQMSMLARFFYERSAAGLSPIPVRDRPWAGELAL